jgi:hypothetical protein
MPQPTASHRAANAATMSIAPFLALVLLLAPLPAAAQPEIFPDAEWSVQPQFTDAEARSNISGATCIEFRACLAVNDATKFAQFFSIVGTTIRPGAVLALAETDDAKRNLHAEGAAHDTRFLYVVTSRAKDATGGQADTSFLVIRVATDAAGRPPAGTLQVSTKVRDALTAGIAIPQIAGQQLNRSNADIEGIAVKDGVIHLGFRAPVLSGKAFIVSVPEQAVFGSQPFNPTVRALALGPNVGILDLATASDGILILAGPSQELAGPPSLFHMSDATGQVKRIANIVQPVDKHAETLILLQEDPELYVVLLMFDGVANGGPLAYGVPR